MEDRSFDRKLGRYQQVATLGQGGMGTVYLVLASGFGQFRKLLVIKELRQDLTCQKGFIRLFMDEAKLAARLAHPNVVQTFEAFQEGNRYLLAMEYLDGQALSSLIMRLATEGVRMPLGMHIHILCEVLSGLHYAHELRDYDGSPLGVVHRDVSPQNVFLTYHGGVKVVDFGVAKAANAALGNTPGLFVGKFSYAAPEQLSGRPVDARTDMFAVGVMLWQAIAERRFSAGTPTPEATQARAEGSEPRIREVVPDVDPDLADICDRAIEVDPDKRYPSAQAFRTALQTYLEAREFHTHDAEIGQLMLRMFSGDREKLHTQIEDAVEASRQSKADTMTNDEREPTTKVDLSRAQELTAQAAAAEHSELYTSSNVMRLSSSPEASAKAGKAAPSKRVLRAGAIGLGVLALGTLYSLNARVPPDDVETKLLPATLVTPAPVSVVAKVAPAKPLAAAKAPSANPPIASAPPVTVPVSPSTTTLPVQPSAAQSAATPAEARRLERAARRALANSRSELALEADSGNTARQRRGLQSQRAAAGPTASATAPAAQGEVSKSSASAKTAAPTTIEAGADLGVLRRTGRTQIDVENPY